MCAAALSNVLVLVVLAVGGSLAAVDPDLFYRVSQEDGFLEWATFWVFSIAGCRYFVNAARDRRDSGGVPWFAAGLGVFCMLVALEEISWGQRLLGYPPPDYFLQENYQQELNLHNVFSTSLRKVTLLTILIGYGIHKRLYTFMRDYQQTHLLYGTFAKRLRDAGEYTRANYLLDPWNSPCWLRHKCVGGRVAMFVYSFDPNRQRDSSLCNLSPFGDSCTTY